ncbi:MAG TPA: hypothetical protein VKZ96_13375 [Thermomicrobiales bacterium]|nr:hypothetical protein [Thermomicrobiales bacterium]
MSTRGTERLIAMLGRRAASTTRHGPPDSYEETTRRMVERVEEDVRSLRRRLDALIFMVISAIIAETVSRFFAG